MDSEVFRGDLSAAMLVEGVLQEADIPCSRRFDLPGGVQATVVETAMVPGQVHVVLVPQAELGRARELLLAFQSEAAPESDLSADIGKRATARKRFAWLVLVVILGPLLLGGAILLVMTLWKLIVNAFV